MKQLLAALMMLALLFGCALAQSAGEQLTSLYQEAELLMVQGDHASAAQRFEALGSYSDAAQMAMYCKAIDAAETLGVYSVAVDALNALGILKIPNSWLPIMWPGTLKQLVSARGDWLKVGDHSQVFAVKKDDGCQLYRISDPSTPLLEKSAYDIFLSPDSPYVVVQQQEGGGFFIYDSEGNLIH